VVALGGWRRRRQPGLVLDDPRGLVQRAQRSGLLAREARACRHYARLPFRLAGLRRRREADAPALGAHTRRVLRRDAGLSRADVEALLATGVAR
jgi:crotonobetainyl-CoA:carnitine CoA-transferase CaiB-like acyl-CoA transferase